MRDPEIFGKGEVKRRRVNVTDRFEAYGAALSPDGEVRIEFGTLFAHRTRRGRPRGWSRSTWR